MDKESMRAVTGLLFAAAAALVSLRSYVGWRISEQRRARFVKKSSLRKLHHPDSEQLKSPEPKSPEPKSSEPKSEPSGLVPGDGC